MKQGCVLAADFRDFGADVPAVRPVGRMWKPLARIGTAKKQKTKNKQNHTKWSLNSPKNMPVRKKTRNFAQQMLSEFFLPCKLDSRHILPNETWHISQIMSGTPMRFAAVSNFTYDFFVTGVTLQWTYCSHRCFKWVTVTGSERDLIYIYIYIYLYALYICFYGKDGEDRTSDPTVHNLTSFRRRHCEEVD